MLISYTQLSHLCIICHILGIQDLLTHPNPNSPAQREAYELLTKNPAEYKKRVRKQAANNPPEA